MSWIKNLFSNRKIRLIIGTSAIMSAILASPLMKNYSESVKKTAKLKAQTELVTAAKSFESALDDLRLANELWNLGVKNVLKNNYGDAIVRCLRESID